MKFIDEVDIELVNQELNFHTGDDALVIKGGCDLFTTKPISSDRKLYKTIDKHLTQLVHDNEVSKSLERDRRNSINSLFGSSPSSPNLAPRSRHGSTNSRRESNDTSFELDSIDESPFGSLKTSTTKWTFANLVAILNTSFPDHDFSTLQPTTENFHRIDSPDDLINRFNNIMRSLGKTEEVINWIWDRIDSYMGLVSKDSPTIAPNSRHNSFSRKSPLDGLCQIFEFRPEDQSIIEDMNYPYQTMWSYYWFIYNKKKKKVAFVYLTGINKVHYLSINGNRKNSFRSSRQNQLRNADIIGDEPDGDMSMDDYEEEVFVDDEDDDEANSSIHDLEI